MSVAACADLVRQGDPDRFLAVMAAPPGMRGALFVLFAVNLEVAKAPFVTEQPMIAEMRLQWWRDVVANAASGAARAHEVAGPLHALLAQGRMDIAVLDRLIAVRRWDCWREPHADAAALSAYLDATGGGLLTLAAQATGQDQTRAPGAGWAMALANYLAAVPDLIRHGRSPLPHDVNLPALADEGLARLAPLRGRAPALAAAAWARPLLRQVRSDPAAVTEGRLGLSEFRKRARLIRVSIVGF
jgi:15-cis-phytoene synthase